ncbi:MAG: hypothetical protein NTV43_07760 [Methylococcales bacterium]|nr:hypothetical protein [Methylococcales bacterium]
MWREHGDMLADANSTGQMIGFNVDAAIMFNDSKSATDILSALRGKPGIIAAQIYTPEGNAFAHYNADQRFIYLPGTLVDADREVNANSKLSLTYNMIQPITQHLLANNDDPTS